MGKRIKFAIVSLVSLCKRGANRLPGLYKSEDDQIVFEALAKMDEQGMLTSLVYAPDREDSQGHRADATTIETMAHSFMERGAQLDLNHDLKPLSKEQAYVAESFIVQPGDQRFVGLKDASGNDFDPTGAWCLKTKLVDPDLRKLYREEGWNGVSLYAQEGDYELEDVPDPKAVDAARKVGIRKQEKSPMDEEKLAAALAKALEPLSKKLDDLKKSGDPPAAESGEDDSEEFVIPNPADRKAWAKYKADLKKREAEEAAAELREEFDLTTTEGCEEYEAALAKALKKTDTKSDDNKPERYGESSNDMRKSAIYSGDNSVSEEFSKIIDQSLDSRNLRRRTVRKGA